MTSPLILPTLPGLSWSGHKKPTFSTKIASHASGREVRAGMYAYALYEFEVSFEGLDSEGIYVGLGPYSLQRLMSFYLQCQGALRSFVYVDPRANDAAGQLIGTGDGTTTSFTVMRSVEGYSEPASYVTSIARLLLNGVATAAFTLEEPNIVTLDAAPADGVVITADFSYGYRCRFLEDQIDLEEVNRSLWALRSLKFRTVR